MKCLNLKLSNSQPNQLKSATKNKTRLTMKLLSDVIGHEND